MKKGEILYCSSEDTRGRNINSMDDGFRVMASFYNFNILRATKHAIS